MTTPDLPARVRRYFDTYRTGDRAAIEALLSDDFTFTSPRDDRIDRAACFERCWPGAGSFAFHHLQEIHVRGQACLVLYDAELRGGKRLRNAEYIRFRDGRITSIEVFFGRAVEP